MARNPRPSSCITIPILVPSGFIRYHQIYPILTLFQANVETGEREHSVNQALHYVDGLPILHVCLKRTGTCSYCSLFRPQQVLLRFDTLCDRLSRWSGHTGSKNGGPERGPGSWCLRTEPRFTMVRSGSTKFYYGCLYVSVSSFVPLTFITFYPSSLKFLKSNIIYESLIRIDLGYRGLRAVLGHVCDPA